VNYIGLVSASNFIEEICPENPIWCFPGIARLSSFMVASGTVTLVICSNGRRAEKISGD